MEFNQLVKERRSVRKYQVADVKEDDIKQIIECAQLAPSWRNSQTARYYVACSEEMVNKVYECLPDFNQNSSKNARYIIVAYQKGISGNPSDLGDYWGAYDLGLANSYLILKAKDLGYDTLIMGLRDENKLRELFNISEKFG